MMREFTAVKLFYGAGGMDLGFGNAGFHTIWANDFDWMLVKLISIGVTQR